MSLLKKKEAINLNDLKYEFKDNEKIFNEIIAFLKENRVIIEKDTSLNNLFDSINNKEYFLGLERQIECLFDLFPNENPIDKQLSLKKTKVAVLGLGIVAQYTILPLIAAGIGNFIIVDFDKVEKRNIGRQPMLTANDIGQFKTKVIKKYIESSRVSLKAKKFNLMIRNTADVKKIIKESDIVIQACDYPRFKIRRIITKACLSLRKPNISVYSGKIGPFNIPYETSCFGCYETLLNKNFPFYFKLTKIMQKEGIRRYPEIAVVPAVTGVIAAKEIVSFLLGYKPQTINSVFIIDNKNLQLIQQNVPKQKNCYLCKR